MASSGNGSILYACANLPLGSNCSNLTEDEGSHWTADVIQRVASLVFIIVLSLVGNTVIIIVLTFSKYRKRHSRVNIFILNLAIGDLTVTLVTMTTEIIFVAFDEWRLGPAACKIIPYTQIITLASTTFILTAMSFDRYMAICRPLSYRATTTRAKRMIAVSWIMAFIFALPQIFIFVQVETMHDGVPRKDCKSKGYTAEWQRKLYFTFLTLYILVVPAIFISYCYINVAMVVWRQGREITASKDSSCSLRRAMVDKKAIPRAKIKTIKMTFCIIVTFIACWSPYFVTTLIKVYSDYKIKISPSVMAFVETVAPLQSALNPIIYGFFSIKMKRGLMEVFCPKRLTKMHRGQSFKENGMTECLSVSEDCRTVHGTMRISSRYRDPPSSSSSSSHGGLKNTMITEENKNGYRLRVRFAMKETPKYTEKAVSANTIEHLDGNLDQTTCM